MVKLIKPGRILANLGQHKVQDPMKRRIMSIRSVQARALKRDGKKQVSLATSDNPWLQGGESAFIKRGQD